MRVNRFNHSERASASRAQTRLIRVCTTLIGGRGILIPNSPAPRYPAPARPPASTRSEKWSAVTRIPCGVTAGGFRCRAPAVPRPGVVQCRGPGGHTRPSPRATGKGSLSTAMTVRLGCRGNLCSQRALSGADVDHDWMKVAGGGLLHQVDHRSEADLAVAGIVLLLLVPWLDLLTRQRAVDHATLTGVGSRVAALLRSHGVRARPAAVAKAASRKPPEAPTELSTTKPATAAPSAEMPIEVVVSQV